MKKLSRRSLESAERFLQEQARPLENARWEFHCGRNGADRVLTELAKFGNPDGGFGRGLESDMRSDGSSVLATLEAMDIMAELKLPAEYPALIQALEWLQSPASGFDESAGLWPYLPPGLDEAPHAPWWDMENLSDTFGGFLINPRGRVLAYLNHYGFALPENQLSVLMQNVESIGTNAPPDTLRSLLILHESLSDNQVGSRAIIPMDPNVLVKLESHIRRLIPGSVVSDPDKWTEYGLQPLDVASAPDSPWFNDLKEIIPVHLEYICRTQQEDGSWLPFWTWGEYYPEAWAIAKQEWKGVLTLKNLKRLDRFSYISGNIE